MGVADDFRTFCSTLAITRRSNIASRYGLISRRMNIEYWGTESKTSNSFYTGSFGRGTAVDRTSDVDMIVRLPYETYERFNSYSGNGQAALLEEVRQGLMKTYSVTRMGRNGCVIVIPFDDGIQFDVQPAFRNKNGSYTYPNSHDGGKWKTTNPKPEIEAIAEEDAASNKNLKRLCKMIRAWKETWSAPIGGLLIDTLAYQFIKNWEYRDKSYLYYDWMTRDFLDFLASQDRDQDYWLSPGAKQYVWRSGVFEAKAKKSAAVAREAIAYAAKDQDWSARQRWRQIYGTGYPS